MNCSPRNEFFSAPRHASANRFSSSFLACAKETGIIQCRQQTTKNFCAPGDKTPERESLHVQILRLGEVSERLWFVARTFASADHEPVRRESHNGDQSRPGGLSHKRPQGR